MAGTAAAIGSDRHAAAAASAGSVTTLQLKDGQTFPSVAHATNYVKLWAELRNRVLSFENKDDPKAGKTRRVVVCRKCSHRKLRANDPRRCPLWLSICAGKTALEVTVHIRSLRFSPSCKCGLAVGKKGSRIGNFTTKQLADALISLVFEDDWSTVGTAAPSPARPARILSAVLLPKTSGATTTLSVEQRRQRQERAGRLLCSLMSSAPHAAAAVHECGGVKLLLGAIKGEVNLPFGKAAVALEDLICQHRPAATAVMDAGGVELFTARLSRLNNTSWQAVRLQNLLTSLLLAEPLSVLPAVENIPFGAYYFTFRQKELVRTCFAASVKRRTSRLLIATWSNERKKWMERRARAHSSPTLSALARLPRVAMAELLLQLSTPEAAGVL